MGARCGPEVPCRLDAGASERESPGCHDRRTIARFPLPSHPPDMTGVTVRRVAELRTRVLAASGLALLLLVFAAESAAGAATSSLTNPSVSPNPSVAGSTVTFQVTYTDPGGAAPYRVRVYSGGNTRLATFALPGSGDWVHGVTLTATTSSLAVGSYPIVFRAWQGDAAHTPLPDLAGGTLVISAAPSPTPTHSPTPTPTPTPSSPEP